MEPYHGHDPRKLMEPYGEQAKPDLPPKTDSTLRYVRQIQEWVSACDKLHPDTCVPKPIPEWPPEDIPLWLIDTHCYCIVPGPSAHRYLALSYVWPESRCSPESASPVPRTLLLNQANVQALQKPGFLRDVEIAHQMPNIIKHGLKLTRDVGERYLWVDRLCIVQHDLGDEGTLSQVAKMDKIYAGAYFTIIAAAPEEMYEDELAFEALVPGMMQAQCGNIGKYPYLPIRKPYPASTKSEEAEYSSEDNDNGDADSHQGIAEPLPDSSEDDNIGNLEQAEGMESSNQNNDTSDSNPNSAIVGGEDYSSEDDINDDPSLNSNRLEEDVEYPDIYDDEFSDYVEEAMSKNYQILSRSRWATRGWTYQEQTLCKRAIFFAETVLFWDCQCAMWDGVKLCPGQNFAGIDLRTEMGQRISTRWWPDFALYIDLLCAYNGRQFSYPQDALLGFGGILNGLEKSFPGGFVYGLPRLFFDHALLWQPFGTASRRIDRVEDLSVHSSLPSWSWCGWQGFVDPWSLRSGLAYIHDKVVQNRARTWQTRNLVQWGISFADQSFEPILEPGILDHYVDMSLIAPRKQLDIPKGWKHMNPESPWKSTKELVTESYFFHERDGTTLFKHPVPLKLPKEESPTPLLAKALIHLTCSTTTAVLMPAALLKRENTSYSYWLGISKISAFEDKIFKRGPADEMASPVLVLQQEDGSFAGLLRLMTDSNVDQDQSLQLIAISTGTANAEDLRQSFEWKIFERGEIIYDYESTDRTMHYTTEWISDKGKNALLFDFVMAFDQAAAGNAPLKWDLGVASANIDLQTEERILEALPKESSEEMNGIPSAWESEEQYSFLLNSRRDRLTDLAKDPTLADNKIFRDKEWFGVRTRSHYEDHGTDPDYFEVSWNPLNRMAWGVPFDESLKHQQSYNQNKMICEFYNVLWVENKNGISHRRACGWIPKHIWEFVSTGPVEIKLG